jgi:hypothetical protein
MDNNVIYVGQGEVTVRGNVSYGHGMYKSTDAGKTWAFSGLKDSKHVSRIRIHPKNPDLVYAAVLGDLLKHLKNGVSIAPKMVEKIGRRFYSLMRMPEPLI